jgi:LuxR family maltose regulon positive regulatory protein
MRSSEALVHAGMLRTRLLPPRLPAACVPRADLVERIRIGAQGRLVSVVAAAGWGKSTLLAQSLPAVGMPWIWLSCDERIGETRSFLAHVAAGLAGRFPGVGEAVDLEGSLEDQVAELCNELADTVVEDFLLVLDDAHVLERHPAAEALGLLVQDLPPQPIW